MRARVAFVAACITACALAAANSARVAAAGPTVAFFGFELINTSLQPTTPAEATRLAMLDDMLVRRLDRSGRFTIVPIAPALQRRVEAGPALNGCNGCERDYAKAAGADWAAWGTVQKVSNLILNINLYMEDAATGKNRGGRGRGGRGGFTVKKKDPPATKLRRSLVIVRSRCDGLRAAQPILQLRSC